MTASFKKKEYGAKYYQDNKEELLKYQAEYRDNHREYRNRMARERYRKKRDEIKSQNAQNYRDKRSSVLLQKRGYYEKNKARIAANQRFKKTGWTKEMFDKAWAEQNGECAICFKVLKSGSGGAAADHCHKTNRPRELLCSRCNGGLGHFKDDSALLKAAMKYLEKHNKKVKSQSRKPKVVL